MSTVTEELRLNLGCGEFNIEGWTNVDAYPSDRVHPDIVGDFREMDFENVAEVNMSHVLEHIPHTDTMKTLARIYRWMKPGAKITIEVPDMERIATMTEHPYWLYYTYGNQANPGEYHYAGFTSWALRNALAAVGFRNIEVRAFYSEHHYRLRMPCLEATAYA